MYSIDIEEQHFKTNVWEKRLDGNCTLQVITREGLNAEDYAIDITRETKGIRKYKFVLDPFQKAAVLSVGKISLEMKIQIKIHYGGELSMIQNINVNLFVDRKSDHV